MRANLRRWLWMTRALHRDYPGDTLWQAARTAFVLTRAMWSLPDEPAMSEQERFMLEVSWDLACLPVVEEVA